MKAYVIKTAEIGGCETCYAPGGEIVAVLVDEAKANDYLLAGPYEMEEIDIDTDLPTWVVENAAYRKKMLAERDEEIAAKKTKRAHKNK